jgi:hypothetical protein
MGAPITSAAMLATQFVADFPEFNTSLVVPTPGTNPVQISPSTIQYWANVAWAMLNTAYSRWTADGDPNTTVFNMGLEMFVAHHVILEVLAQRDMDVGGIPGVAVGIVAGKSAGDVSISYDTGSVLEMNAGHWNYTIYGKRFYRLTQIIGAGPVQVGTPGCGPQNGAWPGPGYPWLYEN